MRKILMATAAMAAAASAAPAWAQSADWTGAYVGGRGDFRSLDVSVDVLVGSQAA